MGQRSKKRAREYANQWYAKNKEKVKSRPGFKEAKKISDRKYYEKNMAKLKERAKEWRENNKERNKSNKVKYYADNRDKILEKRKDPERKAATKKYMKMYRELNKVKIAAQNKKKGAEWMKKQIDALSDAYIIGRLCNQRVGIFKTHAEAKKHPDIIEATRTKILLSRIKRKINQHDKVRSTRDNKRYKNIG